MGSRKAGREPAFVIEVGRVEWFFAANGIFWSLVWLNLAVGEVVLALKGIFA